MEKLITVFRTVKDVAKPHYYAVSDIFKRIKEGESKELVRKIRKETDKHQANELKKNLPAICFSGKFSKRDEKNLIEHSGLICLDFDKFQTNEEMIDKKEFLTKDPFTYAVFVSPSGNGLKVIVKIPATPDKHKSYFSALETYYNCKEFDTSTKDVCRVCYESYDPSIFINENAKEWTKEGSDEIPHYIKGGRPTIPLDDESEIIERLMKWWESKFGFTAGNRNNHLYILANAFNEYGIGFIKAQGIFHQYSSKDFPTSEINTILHSAYSKDDQHKTKYFEDSKQIDKIKTQLKNGVPKKELRSQLNDSGIEDAVIDSVLSRLEEEKDDWVFWKVSHKGVISIIHYEYKEFLEHYGFRKFAPDGGKGFVFVRINDNLIKPCTEDNIKDFVLNHILEVVKDTNVFNYFAENIKYFKRDFLTMLDSISIYFIEDTKDDCYLYYRNGVVKVDKDNVSILNYEELGGYVWANQVIDRDFTLSNNTDCDYKKFIRNVSGDDEQRIKSVESTIGFLMHGYKRSSYCPAVIINDEVISENPEGGTGKGLFMTGVSQIKKTVVINGKDFSFDKTFAYQLVGTDTQILDFDDVKKNFTFERLFSVITEGITVELKNKDAFKIPFSKSPKIVITTNYAIQGKGNSFERRKWEMEFKQYYSKKFTPEDEFGCQLFTDWNVSQWNAFDNYMVQNLKSYLRTGLVECKFVNLKERKFRAETNSEFADWINDDDIAMHMFPFNRQFRPDMAFNKFLQDNNGAFKQLGKVRFNSWIRTWAVYKTGNNPIEGRDADGKWMMIKNENAPTPIEPKSPEPVFDFDEDDIFNKPF